MGYVPESVEREMLLLQVLKVFIYKYICIYIYIFLGQFWWCWYVYIYIYIYVYMGNILKSVEREMVLLQVLKVCIYTYCMYLQCFLMTLMIHICIFKNSYICIYRWSKILQNFLIFYIYTNPYLFTCLCIYIWKFMYIASRWYKLRHIKGCGRSKILEKFLSF
jgi:hypothetical protein